jgi:hypothetical protein
MDEELAVPGYAEIKLIVFRAIHALVEDACLG